MSLLNLTRSTTATTTATIDSLQSTPFPRQYTQGTSRRSKDPVLAMCHSLLKSQGINPPIISSSPKSRRRCPVCRTVVTGPCDCVRRKQKQKKVTAQNTQQQQSMEFDSSAYLTELVKLCKK